MRSNKNHPCQETSNYENWWLGDPLLKGLHHGVISVVRHYVEDAQAHDPSRSLASAKSAHVLDLLVVLVGLLDLCAVRERGVLHDELDDVVVHLPRC